MNAWFYKSLGDAIMAAGPVEQIRAAFHLLSESQGTQPGLAVFTRTDSESRLHCEVSVYFSPAAAGLARMFEAQPSEQPLRAGLELLAGDQDSWTMLFSRNTEV